jgi:bacteriocin-like protein
MKTNKQVQEQPKKLAKPTLPVVPLTDKDMSHVSGGGASWS